MEQDLFPFNKKITGLLENQDRIFNLVVEVAPRLIAAGLILATGYYAGRWAGRMLDRILTRLELDLTIRQLLVRTTRVLVLLLFLIISLQNLGVDLLPMIAGISVAGAGVALAMQGVLSNLAAGLTIIFTHPYKVNEYISIAGEEGMVENISLFSTTLIHVDLSRVVIPNRKIAGEILHNYGEIRQINITVGVAYNTDLELALASVKEILDRNQLVLKEPAPFVQVAKLSDSSVIIGVHPWVNVPDYPQAIGELNRKILDIFQKRGIQIPLPQSEVRLLGETSR